MELRVQVLNAEVVSRALRRVPIAAAREVKAEMAGMQGLGVEWKASVAKTFVGSLPGATRRGEKWIYSKRNKRDRNQLQHFVSGDTLDTLKLTIFGNRRAVLHEIGGTVTSGGSDLLAIPINEARNRGRRKIQTTDLYDAFVVRTRSGRLYLAETDDSTGEAKFYFELKREVENPGGRLRFRAKTAELRNRAVQRFDRALGRAARAYREAA